MKSDEAIEQIAYLKELTANARWRAAECYPLFILWGIIYVPGYILNSFSIWIFLSLAGIILTAYFFFITYKHKNTDNRLTLLLLERIAMQAVVIIISGALIFTVLMKNGLWSETNAFWPFYSGIVMMVIGISALGTFPVTAGAWFSLVSTISVFIPMPYQSVWLEITVGGGAIITGLILRNKYKKAEMKKNKKE